MWVPRIIKSLDPRFYANITRESKRSTWIFILQLWLLSFLFVHLKYYAENKALLETPVNESCVEQAVNAVPDDFELRVVDGRLDLNLDTPIIIPFPSCARLMMTAMIHYGFSLLDWFLNFGLKEGHLVTHIVLLNDDQMGLARRMLADYGLHSLGELDSNVVFFSLQDKLPFPKIGDMDRVIRVDEFLVRVFAYLLLEKSDFLDPDNDISSINFQVDAAMVREYYRQSFMATVEEELPNTGVVDYAKSIGILLLLFVFLEIVSFLFQLPLFLTFLGLSRFITPSFSFWTATLHVKAKQVPYSSEYINHVEREDELLREEICNGQHRYPFNGIFERKDYFALLVHTMTLPYLGRIFFPWVSGFWLHIAWSFFAFRYFALPGAMIEHVLISRLLMLPCSGNSKLKGSGLNIVSQRSEDELFRLQQERISGALESKDLPLGKKLSIVVQSCNYVQRRLYRNYLRVFHVWSRLNEGKDPKGGPGWCYGISRPTGAWILLCWYPHPCDKKGIEALVTYPGLIYFENKTNCDLKPGSFEPLPSPHLPSQADLDELRRKLQDL